MVGLGVGVIGMGGVNGAEEAGDGRTRGGSGVANNAVWVCEG